MRTDVLKILVGPVAGGKPRGHAVHQRYCVEKCGQAQKVDIGHNGRAIGKRGYETVACQPHQCFAYRRARHGKAFGQLVFINGATRRERKIDDLVAQHVVNQLDT